MQWYRPIKNCISDLDSRGAIEFPYFPSRRRAEKNNHSNCVLGTRWWDRDKRSYIKRCSIILLSFYNILQNIWGNFQEGEICDGNLDCRLGNRNTVIHSHVPWANLWMVLPFCRASISSVYPKSCQCFSRFCCHFPCTIHRDILDDVDTHCYLKTIFDFRKVSSQSAEVRKEEEKMEMAYFCVEWARRMRAGDTWNTVNTSDGMPNKSMVSVHFMQH